MAWLSASNPKNNGMDNPPSEYITQCGMAYLNGFLQSNDTIALVKQETYEELLSNYEELIDKYEKLKKSKGSFLYRILNKKTKHL